MYPWFLAQSIPVSNISETVSISPPFSTAFFICEIFSKVPVKIPNALLPKLVASSIAVSTAAEKPSVIKLFLILITSSSYAMIPSFI